MEEISKIQASYFGAEKLRHLLELVKPDIEEDNLMIIFETIAKCMLGEVRIKRGMEIYDILEIEFYYRSPKTIIVNDEKEWKVTYPRKAKAGDWFFHAYGMDLCFNSQYDVDNPYSDEAYYGGILIRGIRNWHGADCKPIFGSGKVCDKLFSVYNAFDNKGYDENMPQIIGKDDEFHGTSIEQTYRYHIEDRKFDKEHKLRFVVQGLSQFDSHYLTFGIWSLP